MAIKLKKRKVQESKRSRPNRRTSFATIKQSFENEGYILLSTEYAPDRRLQYTCPNGHSGSVWWQNWKRKGTRCKQCACIKNSERRRHSIEYVRQKFAAEGYCLLTSIYINNKQKLQYQCSEGHIHSITFSDWKSGYRCPSCYEDVRGDQARKHTIEDIRVALKAEDYQLITEDYQNIQDKITYICPTGHYGEVTWANWYYNKTRCSKCFKTQSQAERELQDEFIKYNPLTNVRDVIFPKELDLYFPQQKVAVEYCGLYWHCDEHSRITSSYHRDKLDQCLQKGIRLITIFEDEWLNHKDVCISRIYNALGGVKSRIYARECTLKQITKDTAKEFLSRVHLQGYGNSIVAFGLYHNKELVQVMTFGKPARAHTAKKKRVLELKRLAAKLDTNIVGGASKLFKRGIKYARDNGYEIIKSYCDLRWGTGKVYEALGFVNVGETRYTPHYTNGQRRYRNQTLASGKGSSATEQDKAKQRDLYRIYDCGHSTWEYRL